MSNRPGCDFRGVEPRIDPFAEGASTGVSGPVEGMLREECPMEGCVLWVDHAGTHTSKPYWPRELREALRLSIVLGGLLGMLERAAADRKAGVKTFTYSGPQCRCLPSIWPEHDPACETLAPPYTVELR